jgi:hypothetical protein
LSLAGEREASFELGARARLIFFFGEPKGSFAP